MRSISFESEHAISRTVDTVILVSPILIVLGFTYLVFAHQALAREVLREGQAVEWIQFGLFLLAGGLGAALALRHKRKARRPLALFYSAVSAGLFVVAMEEISWGQWLFHFDTPGAFEAVNKQRELNLHNLPVLHELSEFARFLIGCVGLVMLKLPGGSRLEPLRPAPILVFWFVSILVLGALDLVNHNTRPDHIVLVWAYRLPEVLELLISLVALLYLGLKWRQGEP